ncbi:Lrp/AsnC ligand binding domain-containing protein [Rhodovulum strictum]|uniref:Lrp/AsnC ligand binding domain-containing protein n=1 Tax=Rhodovulum strictum TaxID=58314 RepID=UPI00387EC99A
METRHPPTGHALTPVRNVCRRAGTFDSLLRVLVPDMAAFDSFHDELTATVRLRNVNSILALEACEPSPPCL